MVVVVSLPTVVVAMTNEAIGADSAISPRKIGCVNAGALSFLSSTWIRAKQVAEAEAMFVERIVRL